MELSGRAVGRSACLALASLLIAVGTLLVFGTIVSATTANQTGTATCPTTSNDGICISQVSADYTATTITLTMTVGQATDPTTDPNWASSSTDIVWELFTGGASTASYSATESVVSGQF